MSIHAEVGLPGAGKSYNAVLQAVEAMRMGRVVVTNLPFKKTHPDVIRWTSEGLLIHYPSSRDELEEGQLSFSTIDGWLPYGEKDNPFMRDVSSGKGEASKLGALIIVDEAQNVLTKMIREKRKEPFEYDQLTEFLRVHRHAMVDIILMYHDHTSCDGGMKPLIERWHHIVNMSEFFGFNCYSINTSRKGFVAGKKSYLEEEKKRFTQEIFDYYDSYSEGAGKGTTGRKMQVGLRKGKTLWKRGGFLFLVLALVAIPIVGYLAFGRAKAAITQENTLSTRPDGSDIKTNGSSSIGLMVPPASQLPIEDSPQITSLVLRPDGLPDDLSPLVGFDSENIYFRGHVVNRDADLKPLRFSVIKAQACHVVLVRRNYTYDGNQTEIINYRCERGF